VFTGPNCPHCDMPLFFPRPKGEVMKRAACKWCGANISKVLRRCANCNKVKYIDDFRRKNNPKLIQQRCTVCRARALAYQTEYYRRKVVDDAMGQGFLETSTETSRKRP
jgi:hypothetical protein